MVMMASLGVTEEEDTGEYGVPSMELFNNDPVSNMLTSPEQMEVLQRMRFHDCSQKAGQSVSGFIAELRELASGCGFSTQQELLLRDRILYGVTDKSLQRILLTETKLTLQSVEERALALEEAAKEAAEEAAANACSQSMRNISTIQVELDYDDNNEGVEEWFERSEARDDVDASDEEQPDISSGTNHCPYCARSFRGKAKLERHLRSHTGEKPFPCPDCGKRFSQTYHLQRHLRNIHKQESLDPCHQLPSNGTTYVGDNEGTGDDEGEDEEVNDMAQPEIPITPHCAICDRSFRGRAKLERHLRSHTGEKPFPCPDCGKRFSQTYHLQRHLRNIHNLDPNPKDPEDDDNDANREEEAPGHMTRPAVSRGLRQCSICARSFRGRARMERHLRTHTGEKPFPCLDCGKRFGQNYHLQRHRRVHTRVPRGSKRPKRRGKTSQSEMELKASKQLTQHKKKKPYLCSRCDERFSNLEELTAHLPNHEGEKPMICTDCGKTFLNHTKMLRHQKLHSGKQHLCNECGKVFTSPTVLMKHMQTHTGERPYLCAECGMTFRYSSQYYMHKRKHKESLPRYSCSDCGRTYSRLSDVQRHLRTHTGERPYQCPCCDKSFHRQEQLTTHTRIHTGEKPYGCHVCGKKFTQSGDKSRHMSRFHPDATS